MGLSKLVTISLRLATRAVSCGWLRGVEITGQLVERILGYRKMSGAQLFVNSQVLPGGYDMPLALLRFMQSACNYK